MKRASNSSEEDQNNLDRLSELPDGVICHVLSFLPTQNSVQTSILAKRWRFLWAHVPVLDFKCFPGTARTVLLRHEAKTLTTFRLTYNGDLTAGGYNTNEVETCISVAVERSVQNLYLALGVEVPRCLLTCKTLVGLTLRSGARIPSTVPTISLHNLKKLHLWYLEVDFTRLLSGCPVLEELHVEGTTCRDPKGCYISSPTLKRLTFVYLLDHSMFDNPDLLVTINTPALRFLKVRDVSRKHILIDFTRLLSDCPVLEELHIQGTKCRDTKGCYIHSPTLKRLTFDFLLSTPMLDENPDYMVMINTPALRYLKVCDVSSKHISISPLVTSMWEPADHDICGGLMIGSMAKFGNLTKLNLSAPWCILTKFLESAHHLQVLTFFEGDWHSHQHWMEPIEEERWACLFHSLTTVRIDGFRSKEQGFNMVKYILRNAQVLERMEIITSSILDRKENFHTIERI